MAFSSDDELIEALGHVADNDDGVFRIFAEEVDDQPLPSANRRCVSDVGIFPPMHLLQTAASVYGPLIHGLLSASSQQHGDDGRQTTANVDSRAPGSAADSSSCCEGATADGNRSAGTGGIDAAGSSAHQPAASSCASSHHAHDGGRAAEEFLANIFSGLGAMLNTFGT